jgi:hypothetical protein
MTATTATISAPADASDTCAQRDQREHATTDPVAAARARFTAGTVDGLWPETLPGPDDLEDPDEFEDPAADRIGWADR